MSYVLQDSYETDASGSVATYGVNWRAQSFTTNSAYTISRVGLYVCRTNTAGDITVSIRAVDGSHLPTEDDLAIGTVDTTGHSACPTPDWIYVDFNVPYALSNSTEYAIVVRCLTGDASNRISWTYDGAPAGFGSGIGSASANSGANWSGQTWDAYFRTYSGSDVEYVYGEASIAGSGSLTATALVQEDIEAACTITGSGSLSAYAVANLKATHTVKRLVVAGSDTIYFES